MAYLRNASFNAADVYSMTASFWLRLPTGGWNSSLLGSEQSDTWEGAYTNYPINLSCVQGIGGTTSSFSLQIRRTPVDSPYYYDTDITTLINSSTPILASQTSSYYTAHPYHLIGCPSLGGDVHPSWLPPWPVVDSTSASGLVGHIEGHDDNGSWSQDIDFSGMTYKLGTNSWPWPDGSDLIGHTVAVRAWANIGWVVDVQGQGVDLVTTYRNRTYRTSASNVLDGGNWNHVLFAINNNTKTQSWRINGTTRTSAITENSTNPNDPWQIRFDGIELCLPTKYTHPLFRMADFQLWAGQYIDPTNATNFSKFVRIDKGKGYPVDPAIATRAFGQQTILFRGKASDASFWVNRGNGGSFSKVGTINDFTPAPSYG